MTMDALLQEISRHHFPNPPATPKQIEEFERRVGWCLDSDLRAFYPHCDGAALFKRRPDADYRFLALSEILRARVAIRGKDDDSRGPASMYTLCDLQDGDYILVDVSRQQNGRYSIIDGWHEAWPDPDYCKQVAGSFSEFLEGALQSGGNWFWLKQQGT
jgi:cell wall assembly regulator SMI1